MRSITIVGNWKMNTNLAEGLNLASEIRDDTSTKMPDVDIILCPPFPYIKSIAEQISGSQLHIGSQNVAHYKNGAYTGEVSTDMLKDIGASHVILGHSERRSLFSEDNLTISKKLGTALAAGLIPIICIGEQLEEREHKETETVLANQLEGALIANKTALAKQTFLIAYEPVWAIGTGKVATADQAQDAHRFTRTILAKTINPDVAEKTPILYGGSVKPENIAKLIKMPDIDGALVGGASLKSDAFVTIIRNAQQASVIA